MMTTTIYDPKDWDSFGQYEIHAGHIHVFPFIIPMFGRVVIELTHIMPNSQDFSLDSWITTEPLDGLVLQRGFGHFKPVRRQTQFDIYDQFLENGEEDDRLFLSSGRTYYLNVKDLQNRVNAYELFITPKASGE